MNVDQNKVSPNSTPLSLFQHQDLLGPVTVAEKNIMSINEGHVLGSSSSYLRNRILASSHVSRVHGLEYVIYTTCTILTTQLPHMS